MTTPVSQPQRHPLRVFGIVAVAAVLLIAASQWKSVFTYFLKSKAIRQASQAQMKEALECARRAREYSPEDAEVLLLVCRLERQSGLLQESEVTIEALQSLGVPETRIQHERHLTAARSGDLESAEPFLPQLLASDELDSQDVCEAFVIGYRTRFRIDESRTLAEVWKKDYPQDFRPYAHVALIAQMATDWGRAVEEFQKAVDYGDRRAETLVSLGLCCLEINELDRGIKSFQLCTELYPENADGWLGLADSQSRLGMNQESARSYDQCLKLDPYCFEAELARSRLLLVERKAEQAAESLGALVQRWPEDTRALFQYGQALSALGKTSESSEIAARWKIADHETELMEQLLTKLQGEPQNVALRCQIGVMMMKHYSRPMAVQFLSSVLLEEPGNIAAHASLADYYQKRGQTDLAEKHRTFFGSNEL